MAKESLSVSWYDLPPQEYLRSRWEWVAQRAQLDPAMHYVINVEGVRPVLEAQWLKDYWLRMIEAAGKWEKN